MKTHIRILLCTLVLLAVGIVGGVHAADPSFFTFDFMSVNVGVGSLAMTGLAGVPAKNNHRAVYNTLKQNNPGAIITDSYLRFETSIQGSFTQIRFNALVNDGVANFTERRLAITDKFCVTQMGLFIMKAGSTTTASQAQIAGSLLHTYPNPLVFTGGAGAESVALQNLYNGYLQVRIDSTVWFDSLDLMRFYRVPVSQQAVALTLTPGAANLIQRDGWDILNYGFCPIDPTFTMSGRGKNELSIQLPTSVDLSGSSSQNFAVLISRGFLMQNAAKNS